MNYAGATATYALPGVSQPIWYTAQSYSGQYALVGAGNFPNTGDDVWVSQDYGATFTIGVIGAFGFAGAISGNGQYMVSGISTTASYISSDYGSTFAVLPSLNGLFLSNITISEMGQYMFVSTDSATNARVRQSSDYGATFSLLPSPVPSTFVPYSAAMSGNGQYRFISGDPRYGSNQMFKSDDYGNTYVETTSLPTPSGSAFYLKMSMSANGQYRSTFRYNYTTIAYISNDYGFSFTTTTFPSNIQSASISGSGQYFGFVLSTGAVYISNNFGKTFINLFKHGNAPHDKAISFSYSGDYILVGGNSTTLTLYKGYGAMNSTLLLQFVLSKNP